MLGGQTKKAMQAARKVGAEDTFIGAHADLSSKVGRSVTEREVLSYRLYPKVYLDYLRHQDVYGDLTDLPTTVFFYGLKQGQEFEADLERGKTLVISLSGISAPDGDSKRSVFFNLNGFPRVIEVVDQTSGAVVSGRLKADPLFPGHVGAAMSGKVQAVTARDGQSVRAGDALLVVEAMKMEYLITAKHDGTVAAIHVKAGDLITSGDLLVVLA